MKTETETEIKPLGLRALTHRQVVFTFAGVLLAMFLSSLDQTVVGTAMPRIITDLGGFSQYTWVTTAYIITSAVAIPIVGKFTDMYGRKYLYMSGILLFILASFLCGMSNTMTQIIIFRGIQGIGAGIMMANAFTVIGDLFPPAERGRYQGFMSAVFGLSSIIGPPLGGYITDSISWHWVFFINIPLGIMILVLFLLFFPNIRPDKASRSIDYPGVTFFILAVVPALLALSWGGVEYPWGSIQIIGMFVFAAIMLALFIRAEGRSPEPIIPLSLFKDRIVAISEVVNFFTGFAMFGGIIFVPLFFQGVLGATATASGSFLTPMMLGMVTGSFVSGQLLVKKGGHYRFQGAGGIAIMGVGLFLLSMMDTKTSYGTAIANIVITGFGLGITMPLYIIAIQNAVPYRILGVATSSAAFFRSIGGSVGLAVLGSVLSNRFITEFTNNLPLQVRAVIPPDMLSSLTQNPQALMDPGSMAQFNGLLGQLGSQGQALAAQILAGLRQALSLALSQVFLTGLIVIGVAFVANLFIKEIPLRRSYSVDNPVKSSDSAKPATK